MATTLPSPAEVAAASPPTAVKLVWADADSEPVLYNLEELADILLDAADIPAVLLVLKAVDDHMAGGEERDWSEFKMLNELDRAKTATLINQMFKATFDPDFGELLAGARSKWKWLKIGYVWDTKTTAVELLLGFLDELRSCDRVEFIHLRP